MQKKLLPIAFSFLSFSAIAQPIITNNSNPLHGDTYTYYRCDSVGPGSAGANVTWNFAGLDTIPGASMSLTYKSCPGWAECDTFPGSNMSLASPDTTGGVYYLADANKFAWNGEHPIMGPRFKYSNPKEVRHYPFTMGDSYSDSSVCVYTAGITTNTRRTQLTVTADAYGTLQLPNGTHSNVLRMHQVDVMRDSSHNFPYFQNYIRDVYEWWKPNGREFLLRIDLLHLLPAIVGLDTITVTSVTYTSQVSTSVNETVANNDLNIYPVPAHGELTIEITDAKNNNTIHLLDMMGKEVMKVACVAGQQQYKVNTLAMPAGVYILRINSDKGIITRKVEIL